MARLILSLDDVQRQELLRARDPAPRPDVRERAAVLLRIAEAQALGMTSPSPPFSCSTLAAIRVTFPYPHGYSPSGVWRLWRLGLKWLREAARAPG